MGSTYYIIEICISQIIQFTDKKIQIKITGRMAKNNRFIFLMVIVSLNLLQILSSDALCQKQVVLNFDKKSGLKCVVQFNACPSSQEGAEDQFRGCDYLNQFTNEKVPLQRDQCLQKCCSNSINQFSFQKLQQRNRLVNAQPSQLRAEVPQQALLSAASSQVSSNTSGLKIGLGVGLSLVGIAVIAAPIVYYLRKKRQSNDQKTKQGGEGGSTEAETVLPQQVQLRNAMDSKQIVCPACKAGKIDCIVNCGHYYHVFCAYTWQLRNTFCFGCRNKEINNNLTDAKFICRKCNKNLVNLKLYELKHLPRIEDYFCQNCVRRSSYKK